MNPAELRNDGDKVYRGIKQGIRYKRVPGVIKNQKFGPMGPHGE